MSTSLSVIAADLEACHSKLSHPGTSLSSKTNTYLFAIKIPYTQKASTYLKWCFTSRHVCSNFSFYSEVKLLWLFSWNYQLLGFCSCWPIVELTFVRHEENVFPLRKLLNTGSVWTNCTQQRGEDVTGQKEDKGFFINIFPISNFCLTFFSLTCFLCIYWLNSLFIIIRPWT